MKRTSRTKLADLKAPVLLPEEDLGRVVGGTGVESQWSLSPPRGPDDVFRLDDH
ncbi:MAG TPA: hypothetical protein VHW23_48070 [Kofleriaceae bacterium]|jgi:hypothetical protein|nr:hypothetical protein [Kofleriaceae bacterium]